MKKTIVLLLIFLLPTVVVAQFNENRSIVFNYLTIIDVKKGAAKSGMTVIVTGNRIAAIGKTGKVKIPNGAEVIDASRKFLIPGLWDMHVHTLFEGRTEIFFPMFIANGVTGVRDLGSPLALEQTNRMRREIEAGNILGPRLGALTGKILDGPGTPLPIANAVTTADEGRQFVKNFKTQGADFIKVYDLLPREVFLAIADEARRERIPFAGHVPFSMTAAEVSDLGQKSIEHSLDVFISAARNEAELRAELRNLSDPALSNQTRNRAEIRAIENFDERKANELFARFVRNGTWLCPTLTVRNATTFADVAEMSNDSRMKYIPAQVRENWTNIFKQRMSVVGSLEQRRKRFASHVELAGKMQRAGVKILAGTDTGLGNPFTFAGFTLHDELMLLVKGGFTPLEALQAATVNPAKFFGLEKSLGTVEKGKLADLVLLDADPLADISNTKKINSVIVNGRFLSREALDKMLAEVETMAKKK
jgi:imidazolonepropionase-like amidohydrolase